MYWNQNLYRLHQAWGGEFLGSFQESDNWAAVTGAVLFLPDREGRVMVNASYDVPPLPGRMPAGQTLWTRVTLQTELSRRHILTAKPENPVKKGLSALFSRKDKYDDRGSERWMPEGYGVETDDPVFARAVLFHSGVRPLLERAREKDPVKLPLFLSLSPAEDAGALHELEVRTSLFPWMWTDLKGWEEEFPSALRIEQVSLDLLMRLTDTARAVRSALRDVSI